MFYVVQQLEVNFGKFQRQNLSDPLKAGVLKVLLYSFSLLEEKHIFHYFHHSNV